MMSNGIKILNSTRDFLSGMLDQMVKLVNVDYKKKKSRKESRIKQEVSRAVYNCPEMSALRNGQLGIDLGIPANQDPTPLIAQAVSDSLIIDEPNFRSIGTKVRGDLKIKVQPNNFSNLLTQSFAYVITEKGQSLPWLSWLLEEGDSVIVFDWSVEYGPFGRSGGGHMVQGGAFTIDPSYSGTPDNNFISRALEGVTEKIVNIFLEQ